MLASGAPDDTEISALGPPAAAFCSRTARALGDGIRGSRGIPLVVLLAVRARVVVLGLLLLFKVLAHLHLLPPRIRQRHHAPLQLLDHLSRRQRARRIHCQLGVARDDRVPVRGEDLDARPRLVDQEIASEMTASAGQPLTHSRNRIRCLCVCLRSRCSRINGYLVSAVTSHTHSTKRFLAFSSSPQCRITVWGQNNHVLPTR